MSEQYNALVDRLEGRFIEADADSDVLDDLIHDIYEHIGAERANQLEDEAAEDAIDLASVEASELNNRGFRAQIEKLLEFHGATEGEALILEALEEATAEPSGIKP